MLVKRCWCGMANAYCARLRGGCDGLGVISCDCGGDLCVCHNHGSVQCDGCPECETTAVMAVGDDFEIFEAEEEKTPDHLRR